jgi:protein-S-isoprenylcysteine O-methyltransferase Ste14
LPKLVPVSSYEFAHPIMIPSLEPSSLALLLSVSGYLALLVVTPPNPPPPRDHGVQDRINFVTWPIMTLFGQTTTITLYLYHILLVLTFPNPPSVLCPHSSRLDHRFFTWTSYSAACTVLAILGASVRLTAYRQLGPNFTFQLARPKKLVTGGLYKYVQHPAYPALLVVVFANLAVLVRRRTAVACWLPMSWWIADDQIGIVVEGVIAVVYLLTWLYGVKLRVADEEKMLKEAFGKEWQEYNARTKRYIPGVI